jgi:hypothetical protein
MFCVALDLELLHLRTDGPKVSTHHNPFVLTIFLVVLLAALPQLGCMGLTSAKDPASSTDPAQVIPSITTQPASQTVTAGQTATFTVAATGTAPLSYQWRKNGATINGATSSSYTTPATTSSDNGAQFTVVVSNSAGSTTSNAAILAVNATLVAITVNPNNATVTAGSTQQFVGNVTGTSNTAVTWTVSGAGCTGAACGTISVDGLYVSPVSVPSPATVNVKAVSVADPTKSASASVTIIAAVAVLLSISPTSASVPTSGTQLFTASVTGTSNTAVTWTVSGAGCSGSSCGAISTSASSAVYLAPTVAPSPATVNVTATSVADPSKSASASVTIVPVVAVTVSPTNASVPTGATQQFNASVTGTSNTAVAWNVAGAGCSDVACGTINSNGLYTAPATVPSPATVNVTATSVADPTKSGAVNLTVVGSVENGPLAITTTDLPQAVTGQAYSATLQATGGTPPYTWSIASGQLPSGLTLMPTIGQITGTPSGTGQFSFVAQVTDASSPKQTATQALVLSVGQPSCGPPNYCSRTDLNMQPYPSTIPCPATSCSGGGSLTGANTTITPTDFNLPMTRVTDNSTWSTESGDNYEWSLSGGSFALPMDITDTRFVVYTNSGYSIPFSWNPSTLQATKLYGSTYVMETPLPRTSVTFSFTQAYVGYALGINASNNPAIYSYDFSNTVTPPTGVQLVDLSTCVPALAGVGYKWNNDVIVSQDDKTFLVASSSTSGQGSSGAVYVIVWNRTNGCRVWNTGTGAVTGSWGTTGMISLSDRFTLHNAVIGEGGTWAFVTYQECLSSSCSSPIWKEYFWQISTLSVTPLTDDSNCGHFAVGYNNAVNECAYNSTYNQPTWYMRPYTNANESPPSNVLNPPSGIPTGLPFDQHPSWGGDNPQDNAPFCTTTYTSQFAEVNTYDNEILCIATSGLGLVWRFGHTFNSTQSTDFDAKIALGAMSADGKWFLWTSDWDGMLGNTSGASNSCTIGTNCRADVFIIKLQ